MNHPAPITRGAVTSAGAGTARRGAVALAGGGLTETRGCVGNGARSSRSSFADLQQVTVGIPKEAADLPLILDRRGEELRAARPEDAVCRSAVGHPDGHFVADVQRIDGD